MSASSLSPEELSLDTEHDNFPELQILTLVHIQDSFHGVFRKTSQSSDRVAMRAERALKRVSDVADDVRSREPC